MRCQTTLSIQASRHDCTVWPKPLSLSRQTSIDHCTMFRHKEGCFERLLSSSTTTMTMTDWQHQPMSSKCRSWHSVGWLPLRRDHRPYVETFNAVARHHVRGETRPITHSTSKHTDLQIMRHLADARHDTCARSVQVQVQVQGPVRRTRVTLQKAVARGVLCSSTFSIDCRLPDYNTPSGVGPSAVDWRIENRRRRAV